MSFGSSMRGVNEVAQSEPPPSGEYLLRISSIQRRDTKSGNGWYYNVKIVVVEPAYKGAAVFEMFNWENPSEDAVRIGQGKFKSLMRAAGFADLKEKPELSTTHKDIGELVQVGDVVERGIPFLGRIDKKKDKSGVERMAVTSWCFAGNAKPTGPDVKAEVEYAQVEDDIPASAVKYDGPDAKIPF